MGRVRMAVMVIALALGFANAAWTQGMWGGRGRQMPQMLGMFQPTVGSGAEYQMTSKGQTMDFAYAIVGKEDVGGATGYWMEIRSQGSNTPGEMVMKQLMVLDANNPQIKRMIMQAPGRPPMEMPMGMMSGMGQNARAPQQGESKGDSNPGEIVGSESITVPAGTFDCQHYRKQGPKGTVDVWISTKVSPYGMVKMTSADSTMVLQKVLTNETSHIQGEVQQFNIPMPH